MIAQYVAQHASVAILIVAVAIIAYGVVSNIKELIDDTIV